MTLSTSLARLRESAPLPVAQLVARALNAKSTLERHQCTLYVGEVMLKLAGAVRLSAWTGDGDRLAGHVRKLARGSLGVWQAIARDGDALVPDAHRLGSAALGPAALAVLEGLVADELVSSDATKQMRKAGLAGFFDGLVAYRNAVIGHGGMRSPAFYARWTERFAAALDEIAATARLLGDRELVVGASSEEGEPTWHVLRGTSALPYEPSAALRASGPGLYFANATTQVAAAPVIAFHSDGVRDALLFLHDAKIRGGTVRGVELLDYITGDIVDRDELREPLGALFARGTSELVETPALAPEPVRVEPGGTLGDFELGDKLGAGGQGTVFRATQKSIGRAVALKVLRPELASDPAALRRFEREARALVRVDHPQIVKIFTVGEDRGVRFYAMELVDGLDLGQPGALDVLRAKPGFAVSQSEGGDYWRALARLFAGGADALAHLHDRGIVHRDIKPANLILTSDGSRLVITDLGLAHLSDGSALTRDHSLLGTLRAMAPEQLSPGPAATAPAVDVFGFGVAMFEVATGRAMRDGANDAVVAAQILQRPPRADRVADVPRRFADTIEKALEAEPAARHASAKALADELRRLATGERTEAAGAPRRRRWWLGGGAAVVAVGAIAVVATREPPTPPARVATAPDAAVANPDAGVTVDADARVTIPMIRIPAGAFEMGSTPAEIAAADKACRSVAPKPYCDLQLPAQRREGPQRRVELSAYEIDAMEVSARDAAQLLDTMPVRFEAETGAIRDAMDNTLLAVAVAPHGLAYESGHVAARDPRRPAVGVTWEGARRICERMGKRLPTEAQWERAARGPAQRAYPWGNDPELRCTHVVYAITADVAAKCAGDGPLAVDRLDTGADISEEGVRDLAGNVSEWVADAIDTDAGYPPCPAPCKDPLVAQGRDRVVRGGAFSSFADATRAASRARRKTTIAYDDVGFRCVK